VRQKTQAIVKKGFEQVGIEVELKAVNAGIYFSSDPGNHDSASHFYADLQMYTVTPGAPDPQTHLRQFASWEVASRANNWSGHNVVRWVNAAYDRLWKQAEHELEPVKRASLFMRMNDLLIEDVVVIPIVWRHEVVAMSHALQGMELTTWDSVLWDLAYWYRQT
jgi:peptide/nickel transport system substrate-binding protein